MNTAERHMTSTVSNTPPPPPSPHLQIYDTQLLNMLSVDIIFLLSRGGRGVELPTILSCVIIGVGLESLGLVSCLTHFVKACN